MTGDNAGSFTIKLDFLNSGQNYKAEIYVDDIKKALKEWCPVKTENRIVKYGDSIHLDVAQSGGFVMILEPV